MFFFSINVYADGLNSVIRLAKGDMRRSLNILQVSILANLLFVILNKSFVVECAVEIPACSLYGALLGISFQVISFAFQQS